MKFSSAFNTSVKRCLYPLFQNKPSRFLFLHLPITTLAVQNLFEEFTLLYGLLKDLSVQKIPGIFSQTYVSNHGCIDVSNSWS